MKKLIIILFLLLPGIMGLSETVEIKYEKKIIEKTTRKEFLNQIAKLESAGRYDVSNKFYMFGKYQASRIALKEYGFSKERIRKLRSSVYIKRNSRGVSLYYFDTVNFTPEEQEDFGMWYLNKIETIYMKKMIEQYEGSTIDGVYITRAGIIASSMLGFRHCQRFLKSKGKVNFSDAFGTSIKSRMQKFEKIQL